MTSFDGLLPCGWDTHVIEWLKEDIPSFDYGGYVVGTKHKVAYLYGKSDGVLAGRPFFDAIFNHLNCTVTWNFGDGDCINTSDSADGRVVVARVTGRACDLLAGERTALNLLARCSGIASHCRKIDDLKKKCRFTGVVAGTRKTTPGFRLVEKYAMLVGGLDTHRMDLSSMIMLKDNHVWSRGSITEAIKRARSVGGFSLKIEVECRSQLEAEEAITEGADIVMLDNFTATELKVVAGQLKMKYPLILIEGSGGITIDTISDYFCPSIDILSMGSVTQGVSFVDFSLKVKRETDMI